MRLRERQELFARLVARLITHVTTTPGYTCTLGEAYRSPEEAARLAALGKGITKSLHSRRLAIDLNLFRDGVYLAETEDHRWLGAWWVQQHELCRWGGDFPRPDGNHYEVRCP